MVKKSLNYGRCSYDLIKKTERNSEYLVTPLYCEVLCPNVSIDLRETGSLASDFATGLVLLSSTCNGVIATNPFWELGLTVSDNDWKLQLLASFGDSPLEENGVDVCLSHDLNPEKELALSKGTWYMPVSWLWLWLLLWLWLGFGSQCWRLSLGIKVCALSLKW